jgi:predicted ABC-type ATPase
LPADVGSHPRKPRIYVLAGVNGAGKSSVGGAMFKKAGQEFFNHDTVASEARELNPGLTHEQANVFAWVLGRSLLEKAILKRQDFAFETTLGGNTMTGLLERAANSGIEVRIWYVGLHSVEMHIARVRVRVRLGGHDIPEAKIRERYDRSRLNLLRLLPRLTELKVFDNSAENDPRKGRRPEPILLLRMIRGRIVSCLDLLEMPEWVKPIVQAALDLPKKPSAESR